MVYYGLKTLTPQLFLPIACILCAVVAISLDSAWTVSATLGIAFMAIGETMGINPALTAGMVLSGACCGDKFSPCPTPPTWPPAPPRPGCLTT